MADPFRPSSPSSRGLGRSSGGRGRSGGLGRAGRALRSKRVTTFVHWFEVTQIAGYVAQGQPGSWHVTVRAGLKPEE